MAALNPQAVDRDGVTIAFAAATAGGDTAAANDQNVLLVKNGGAGSITVTLATPRDVQGLAIESLNVAVAAGAEAAIRLGPRNVFGDVDGNASITYPGGVASVTVAVIQI
jgi:hypothetical protein